MSQPTEKCNHGNLFICSLCWKGDDYPPSSTMGRETAEALIRQDAAHFEKPTAPDPLQVATREIKLNKVGYVALVEARDYERVSEFNWTVRMDRRAKNKHKSAYASAWIQDETGHVRRITMHRFVLEVKNPRLQVDHINHDGLDNRRANLRLADNVHNQANARLRHDNTSGYKGVSFCKARGKWKATTYLNGEGISLGYFTDPKEAADAYDRKTVELYGEFALTNRIIAEQRSESTATKTVPTKLIAEEICRRVFLCDDWKVWLKAEAIADAVLAEYQAIRKGQ